MTSRRNFLWCVLLIFSAGCHSLAFKNPLAPDQTAVAPFLGTWRLTKVGQEDDNRGILAVISGTSPDDLKVEYKAGPDSGVAQSSLHLTSVGGTILASVGQSGLWKIVMISLEQGGTQLIVRALDVEKIKQDVEGDVLAGEVDETGERDTVTIVEATSTQLRDYLEANPSLLTSTDPGVTLTKQ